MGQQLLIYGLRTLYLLLWDGKMVSRGLCERLVTWGISATLHPACKPTALPVAWLLSA